MNYKTHNNSRIQHNYCHWNKSIFFSPNVWFISKSTWCWSFERHIYCYTSLENMESTGVPEEVIRKNQWFWILWGTGVNFSWNIEKWGGVLDKSIFFVYSLSYCGSQQHPHKDSWPLSMRRRCERWFDWGLIFIPMNNIFYFPFRENQQMTAELTDRRFDNPLIKTSTDHDSSSAYLRQC